MYIFPLKEGHKSWMEGHNYLPPKIACNDRKWRIEKIGQVGVFVGFFPPEISLTNVGHKPHINQINS